MGATCSFSCHPEDDHQDVHHNPASTDGDHPNQRALPRSARTVWGGRTSQLQATICTGGAVTVPPKPTYLKILCWKIFNLSFEKIFTLVYSYSEIKLPTDHLSQLKRHGNHSSDRLILLSTLVWLQHSTFVLSWSICPCNF